MTIREIIGMKARETVRKYHGGIFIDAEQFACEVAICEAFAIAILTHEDVGFKEALEAVNKNRYAAYCRDCSFHHYKINGAFIVDADCFCICHTAEAKLEELKELSK